MGNVHLDTIVEYNKFEDINNTKGDDYSGHMYSQKCKTFRKKQ